MIEQRLPNDPEDPFPTSGQAMTELSNRKSIFRKKYGDRKAIKAKMFAEACGYITTYEREQSSPLVEVTGDGFIFSTLLGLIDKEVRTFSWILQLTAIAISIIALYISILGTE